jgi:hypothetical protein
MRTRIQRPKTKAQLISTMQRREFMAWQDLQMCKDIFGTDDDITNRARTRWCAVYEALEELGIPQTRTEVPA